MTFADNIAEKALPLLTNTKIIELKQASNLQQPSDDGYVSVGLASADINKSLPSAGDNAAALQCKRLNLF